MKIKVGLMGKNPHWVKIPCRFFVFRIKVVCGILGIGEVQGRLGEHTGKI